MIKICTNCKKKYESFDYLSYRTLCDDCEKKKRKQKLIFLILTLFIFIGLLSLVSSVTLSIGDTLNATTSNSTMTFSIPIVCDLVIVNDVNITIYNTTCYNGTFIPYLLWNTPNANKDSYDSDFCYYLIPTVLGSNYTKFRLPTGLIEGGRGLFSGLANWAYEVTGGWFWTLMLLAFCVVMFIGTMRYSTPRAFGWASFVGMLGAVFLVIAKLMSWQIASAFILAGCVGFVVLIMNER